MAVELQARSGIGRSNATRSDDINPNVIVSIAGTNQAASVIMSTLTIDLQLNDTPSECQFTMQAGSSVSVGSIVIVALGSVDNAAPLFVGVVTGATQRQVDGSNYVEIDVVCRDNSWYLDKQVASASFPAGDARDMILSLVSQFCPDITTLHVDAGLGAIEAISASNQRPSQILTQIVTLIPGAFWYVDHLKDLHVSTDESSRYLNPTVITNTNVASLVRGLQLQSDLSQVRTRVIVEGASTSMSIALPAGFAGPNSAATWVPVDDISVFLPLLSGNGQVRIGSERHVYSFVGLTSTDGTSTNPAGTTLRAAVAAGDTTIDVTDLTWWSDLTTYVGGLSHASIVQYAKIGNQFVLYGGVSWGADPTDNAQLTGVPASGFGSVASPIDNGTEVQAVGAILLTDTLSNAWPVGTEVVPYAQADDTGAQSTLAALEGGDGIHIAFVSDSEITDTTSLAARASAELDLGLDGAVDTLTYQTREKQAIPGRTISVTLSGNASISGDFLIREVQIEGFDHVSSPLGTAQVTRFPLRTITAGAVRLTNVIDLFAVGDQTS